MSRIFYILALLPVAVSSFAFRYEINGTITDSIYCGKKLGLYDISLPKQDDLFVRIDSCICAPDGKFMFSGDYDKGNLALIGAQYDIEGGVRTDFIGTLVLAEGKTEMEMPQKAPLVGSSDNMALRKLILAVNDDMRLLREKSISVSDFKNKTAESCRKAVAENPQNAVGRYALYYLSNCIDNKDWYDIYKSCTPYLQQHAPASDLAKRIEIAMKTDVGRHFVDIKGVDTNGNTVSLSDYAGHGKITVIDFWASWCRPCIEEIKTTIKPLYEKYGRKGLINIVGIGVSDESDHLRDAIERFNIEWFQILDSTDNPGGVYGFNSIPFIVVVGTDGTIMARGLRGENLLSFIDTLMQDGSSE